MVQRPSRIFGLENTELLNTNSKEYQKLQIGNKESAVVYKTQRKQSSRLKENNVQLEIRKCKVEGLNSKGN